MNCGRKYRISPNRTSGAAEDTPRSMVDANHLQLLSYESRSSRRRNCIENTSRHIHGYAEMRSKVPLRELEPVANRCVAVTLTFHHRPSGDLVGFRLHGVGARSLFHMLRNAPSVMGRAPARRKTTSPSMRSHSSLW